MILGLTGKIGSGKNTVAERLALIHPNVVEVSYAAKLKESFAALFNVRVAQLGRWKNNPAAKVTISAPGGDFHQMTVREALQRYGTEAHRDVFGADFWLDAALPFSPNSLSDEDYYGAALYVVTDVRFENEVDRIHQLDGLVGRVIGVNDNTGSHASEQPVYADFEIDNTVRDDGFVSLDAQLVRMLEIIGSDASVSAEAGAEAEAA